VIALDRQDRPGAAEDRPDSNCIDKKGHRDCNPGFSSAKKESGSAHGNLEKPCTDQPDSYHDKSKTATSELHWDKDSDRRKKSPIVNGGHYMTKGHVVLGSLYTKMRLDVKNYFEPEAMASDRQIAGKKSFA
jgi:hypothetical protein